jgi:hypothetical protein
MRARMCGGEGQAVSGVGRGRPSRRRADWAWAVASASGGMRRKGASVKRKAAAPGGSRRRLGQDLRWVCGVHDWLVRV